MKNTNGHKIGTTLASYLLLLSTNIYAGEVDVVTSLNSTAYHYNSQFGELPAENSQALVTTPSLTTNYASNFFNSTFLIKHTNVKQTGDVRDAEGETDKSYNDMQLNSQLILIQNLMSISLSGVQSYRSVDERQAGVVDKVLSSGSLTKSRQYSAGLIFKTPNPQYIGLDFSSSFSTTDSDRSTDETGGGVNNDNTIFQGRLYQGQKLKRVAWDLTYLHSETSRINFLDFSSTSANAYLSFGMFSDLRMVLTGNSEKNDIDTSNTGSLRTGIDTNSIGAGLEWRSSSNRAFTITYNELDEGESTTEYIGVNANWAFTSRTALQFDYGKRFFGDSYRVNFSHNTKSLRTKLRYSEDITTFASATTSREELGVFVCTIGAIDLSECFQPNTLEYQLQVGEQFRNVFEISPDISEQVFLSKSGGISVGYSARKLTVSLDLTSRDTEYLESARTRKNTGLRLNASYKLGRKTDLDFGSSITKSDSTDEDGGIRQDDIWSTNVTFKRDLSDHLSVSANARYLDRDSNNADAILRDKRITLSVNYKFN
jgi:uncharacterized protein (PEP-CTERM system associated)